MVLPICPIRSLHIRIHQEGNLAAAAETDISPGDQAMDIDLPKTLF